jgi:hypothetical protein
MRTTVRLPDDLMKAVKRRSLDSGRTLAGFIEDALRAALARKSRRAPRSPARLPTYGSGGLLPGVDLDDAASLLDLMEGR